MGDTNSAEIFCVGINHESAPVSVREQMAIPETKLGEKCSLITDEEGFYEAVIISTCNRIEIYTVADPDKYSKIDECFACLYGAEEMEPLPFYKFRGPEMMKHLCRVASGLDSMILGETEILGQVKKSYAAAHLAGQTSRYLNKLFQNVFKIGKFVRTNSKITRGATSVGAAGVDLAEKIFGNLQDCNVMILGAGQMGEMVAKTLAGRGVKGLVVSSRSQDKAVILAEEMGGKAYEFEQGLARLYEADILITATSSPHALLTKEQIGPAVRKRRGRPLFIIDIAVPRDVDEEVASVPGVYLYDMDALQKITESAHARREEQIIICENLITTEIAKLELDIISRDSQNYPDQGNDPLATV
jgi:glutamyl-tRNA reductase